MKCAEDKPNGTTPTRMSQTMECLETPHLRIGLYGAGSSMRDIAVEKMNNPTPSDLKLEDADDPFFIYDLGDVVAKDYQWRKLLPRVEAFYAVKTNPDPVFLRLLLGLGRSFDCASKYEMKMVLDLGVSPDRIIYAHPQKQESHLRFAKEKGVRLMTFDTEEELYKIGRIHPEAKLLLRLRYDDETSLIALGSKFGCRESEVRPLMECAKKIGLHIVGICFHIGHESTNPQIFGDAIRQIRPMFDTGTALGFDMKLLDLGGGFPGRMYPKATFDKYADVIRESLEEHFPAGCGIRIIAEPGTFYTRSAGYLVANIISKRIHSTAGERPTENGTGPPETPVWMYYLNSGVYNAFMSAVFGVEGYFDLPELIDEKESGRSRDPRPSCIWGPTCDSGDVLFSQCILPEMEAGESVLFHDMGSYVVSLCTDFNGFGTPSACYVAPAKIRATLERIFGKIEGGADR